MRETEPHIETDFELERYIIEHRDPRDNMPGTAPHPGMLAVHYLFTDGHLSSCGFSAEAGQPAMLSMDQLADIQAGALRATLTAMRGTQRDVQDSKIVQAS